MHGDGVGDGKAPGKSLRVGGRVGGGGVMTAPLMCTPNDTGGVRVRRVVFDSLIEVNVRDRRGNEGVNNSEEVAITISQHTTGKEEDDENVISDGNEIRDCL